MVLMLPPSFSSIFVAFWPAFRVVILPAPLTFMVSVPLPPLTVMPCVAPLMPRSRVLSPLPRLMVASLSAFAPSFRVTEPEPSPMVIVVMVLISPPLWTSSLSLPPLKFRVLLVSVTSNLPPFATVILSLPC